VEGSCAVLDQPALRPKLLIMEQPLVPDLAQRGIGQAEGGEAHLQFAGAVEGRVGYERVVGGGALVPVAQDDVQVGDPHAAVAVEVGAWVAGQVGVHILDAHEPVAGDVRQQHAVRVDGALAVGRVLVALDEPAGRRDDAEVVVVGVLEGIVIVLRLVFIVGFPVQSVRRVVRVLVDADLAEFVDILQAPDVLLEHLAPGFVAVVGLGMHLSMIGHTIIDDYLSY